MVAEKDFSHHISRFCGIATCGLADEAAMRIGREREGSYIIR